MPQLECLLFCICPIFVSNLFCIGAIFVSNLFCFGPIEIDNDLFLGMRPQPTCRLGNAVYQSPPAAP